MSEVSGRIQPKLISDIPDDRTLATLRLTPALEGLWSRISAWRRWPSGVFVLFGEAGSGRTHLSRAWAEAAEAAHVAGGDMEAAMATFHEHGGRLAIDDAHLCDDEGRLAALMDRARAGRGALLLLGPSSLADWRMRLVDLRSRIAAAPQETIPPPDEALLEEVLRRYCRRQYLRLDPPVAAYICKHIQRTFGAAWEIASEIDAIASRRVQPVSFALAGSALRRLYPAAPDMEDGGSPSEALERGLEGSVRAPEDRPTEPSGEPPTVIPDLFD